MNLIKSVFSVITLICIMVMTNSCKDPRDKTVWDYIEDDVATDDQFNRGVEMLHQDLINHGYMKDHSCLRLDCASNHKNTYADIERVNKLASE